MLENCKGMEECEEDKTEWEWFLNEKSWNLDACILASHTAWEREFGREIWTSFRIYGLRPKIKQEIKKESGTI